jgi:hypothetical protein
MDEKTMETLHSTINGLPILPKNTKQKDVNWGLYSTSHLTIWCPYRHTPVLSREFRRYEIVHRHFIEANEVVWKRMMFALGHVVLMLCVAAPVVAVTTSSSQM